MGHLIIEDEMGGTCRKNGRDEKDLQQFIQKVLKVIALTLLVEPQCCKPEGPGFDHD
jgi:hypothetical protein